MDVAFVAVMLAGQPVPLAPRTESTDPEEVQPERPDNPAAPTSEGSNVGVPSGKAPSDAVENTEAEAAGTVVPFPESAPAPEPTSPVAPVEPDFAAGPSTQATEFERSSMEIGRSDHEDEDEVEPTSVQNPDREGGFISVSAGAGHCGTWCGHVGVLGGGRMEAGYRWGYIALGASASLVGAKYDTSDSDREDLYLTVDASGSTRFSHVGPVLQFFPASQGRFDPYASVGVGFRRVVDVADVEGVEGEVKYWESGVGATLGAGIPIHVTDRVTVGLRYDKSFSIAGQVCATIGGSQIDGVERCEPWSKGTDDLNTIDSRYVRLSRPRPWTVAFEMRFAF
ncbi:MAG: outer membrane beta-barrel protein [Nannocystaceae bacterium]|nr:outer membrane beta-barrel protein [Nannocystaceae bacterium]